MTPVAEALARVLEHLRDEPIALVGGLAVSARSEPRFTRDVDLAVAVGSDLDAESLVRRLIGNGYRVAAQIEQEATGRLATVRLLPVDGAVVCDLLFASSGIEPELVRSATRLTLFADVTVSVASVGHLIALKLLSRSPRRSQDDADLRALYTVADAATLAEAQMALALITSRGYAREKQLEREFSEWLRLMASEKPAD